MKFLQAHLQPAGQRGFTLLELLVVIMVMVTLAVLTLPALSGPMQSLRLGGAAGKIESQFSLARQVALARNLPVEVRIYRDEDAGESGEWNTVAVVIASSETGETLEWVTKAIPLPEGVVFDSDASYSSLLGGQTPYSGVEDAQAPASIRGKAYQGFAFVSDGATNLPSGSNWCLTLKPRGQSAGSDRPAQNFVTIVLDARSGQTIAYRP